MLELRKIMLVFGLLQTAACGERFCRFNQSGPCYAALGHKLNLLMVDDSKYDLFIRKRINDNTQDDPICRVKNGIMKSGFSCDLYINRPEVRIINGTLIINSVKREDSGDYRLDLYNTGGTVTSTDLQVNVEDAVISSLTSSLTFTVTSSSPTTSNWVSQSSMLVIYLMTLFVC